MLLWFVIPNNLPAFRPHCLKVQALQEKHGSVLNLVVMNMHFRAFFGINHLAAVVVLGAITIRASAQVPFSGPIPLRDPAPFNLLFLQFQPQGADVLPPGRNTYRLQLDLINNLLIPAPTGASVVIDNEYQRLTLTWRHGLGDRNELQVQGGVLWRNGGILDGIITFYHHLTGLPADAIDDPLGRDHWPQYRSIIQVINSSGHVLVNQGNGFGLAETLVTLKHSLISPTNRSALALRLAIKLPTGNPRLLLGSGNVDEGISLDGRYAVGRDITLFANVGGALLGHASNLPGAAPHVQQAMLAIEYHPNSRDRYVLQVDAASTVMHSGNKLADQANVTATFGFTHVLNAHLALYASYSENGDIHNYTLPGFSNIGPDISFSVGAEWHP